MNKITLINKTLIRLNIYLLEDLILKIFNQIEIFI